MPNADSIAENLETVKENIRAAAEKSGRAEDDIQLLTVTKTWPAEIVQHTIDAGQTLFGENRVQEAMDKIPQLPSRLEWHLIGPLQKNKVRKALPLFSTLHAIDSLKIAYQVDRIAGEEGFFPKVYLEVNLAGESTKHGFTKDQLRKDLEELLQFERIQIAGLMIIPPPASDVEKVRPYFVQLREFRDELEKEAGIPFHELSMGMSHDYAVAIEEGATIVRVGSAIFGPRKSTLSQ